jgi:hypothetical protein
MHTTLCYFHDLGGGPFAFIGGGPFAFIGGGPFAFMLGGPFGLFGCVAMHPHRDVSHAYAMDDCSRGIRSDGNGGHEMQKVDPPILVVVNSHRRAFRARWSLGRALCARWTLGRTFRARWTLGGTFCARWTLGGGTHSRWTFLCRRLRWTVRRRLLSHWRWTSRGRFRLYEDRSR